MARQSILLIETDLQLSVALELFLRGRSFSVRVAGTPADAMRLAASEASDIAVIGNLPDSMDSGTLAQRLRALLGPPGQILVLAHAIDDMPGVDLIVPAGAHPRAILDGIRTVARRRAARPIALDEAS